MSTTLQRLFHGANGRFLTSDELDILRDLAAGMDVRIAASEELRKHEGAIARETVEKIYQSYPDVKQKYPYAVESGIRDLGFVLRYVSHAVLLNDPAYLDEVLLFWMRTMLNGIGLSDEFLRDSYELLKLRAKARMTPESYAVTEPFLTQVVTRLSESVAHSPTGTR